VTRLAVVGGGRMGEALVTGLLSAGWDAPDISVVEVSPERRAALGEVLLGVPAVAEAGPADGAVVAVKPADVEDACRALAAVGVGRVLSIAAGVPTSRLEGALGEGAAVVRAMPNTPALVAAGVSAIAGGRHASDEDLSWASDILGAVGEVVTVPEKLLDAVTGLSGSGPAYVFLVVEAMVEAGVLAGLPRDVAETLAIGTVAGSARLLTETGDSPAALRAAVTSPGGTTAAGLRELERAGVRAAFLDAVVAATERSKELGTG
jgi:pyrroline-5-carboxylate reductase